MIQPSVHLRCFATACLAALAVVAMPSIAAACPMCKEALASGGGDLVSGIFYSILFMLSMPFLIFGGISTYLYMLVRRARAEQQLAADNGTVPAQAGVEESVGA